MGTQENGPLRCVQLPGCKSTSQRMLILAATRPNGEQTSLSGLSGGDDTRGLIQALTLMGAQFNTPSSDTVRVTPIPRPFRFEGLQLDAGPAGSTFRFLLALLATGQADAILRATPRLLERPQDDLYDWLRERGVQVALLADGSGLHIQSQGLAAGEWLAPTQFTSQFLSGLALATAWRSDVSVRPEALAQVESCPGVGYWALTRQVIELAQSGQKQWCVPSDPSAATFFLVALVLTGGQMEAPLLASAHPEAALHECLFDAGLLQRVARSSGSWVEATGRHPSEPLLVPLDSAPDAGPALGVLGLHLASGLILQGVARLRLKESDRLEGILRLAHHLEAEAEHDASADSLRLFGGGIPATTPREPYDVAEDHRLAMAAGVASLLSSSLVVNDSDCVSKSFPEFWQQLSRWTDA
ncbi:MAG: hypothetical protein HN405_01475 [Planctomycetes bacterium]|nr:hypothetical protein [Planctomycetota bacterium]MBT4028432.1 hypothetical protein [Planctomycetota bacterium]MBT4559697.1 hypothetical protein [Planctomycetota bacterium]